MESADRRSGVGAGGAPARADASDPEVVVALLDVFRHIDLAEQVRTLLRYAVEWSGAEGGVAFVPEAERQALVPIPDSVPPPGAESLAEARLELAPLQGWVDEGEPATPARVLLERAWTRRTGAIPERGTLFAVRSSDDQTAGALLLLNVREEPPLAARVRRLVDLSRPAVDNALQVRAVRDLVIKDDTVECFNRRYFEEFLNEELARASRFRAPLSLIFFDMDGLKQVNSLLGHAMGSRTLHEVSVRVRAKIRKFDKLFRFGGDEFCIVLPETEWHGALEVAERVREAIAGQPFLVAERGESGGVRMTASFGIASFPLHARTKGDLLERADWAMQRVKNGVKNSIAVSEIAGDQRGG